MAKKVIAIDIDDVLSRNVEHFVEWSNKSWGTKLTVDDFDEDFVTMWRVSREESQKRFQEYVDNELAKDHKALKEAIPILTKLKEKYDLILITSRRTVLGPITRKWIDEHFPDLFEVIHHTGFYDEYSETSHHGTKADICLEMNVDYLIDDQPKHCFAVAEVGIQTLLFGDYIWNRQIKELPPRVTKVKNWAGVEDYFNEQQ